MSEIGIYIVLKKDLNLPSVHTSAIARAFRGYFTPHTLAIHCATPGERKTGEVSWMGGFESPLEPKRTAEEMTGPWFRLMPSEVIDERNCWTTVDLPDCSGSLLDFVSEIMIPQIVRISIHGNVSLLLRGPDSRVEPRSLFRELMPVQGIWSPYGSVVTIGGQRFVPSTHLSMSILQSANQWDYPAFSIHAESHVWLEHQDAFRGQARATAVLNTEILASKVRDLVIALGGYVDDVSLGTIERAEFGNEAARISSVFKSTVPGLT